MQEYWRKQTPKDALFPDLIWSRPENKAQAGKLLIIGGNAQSFAAAAEAYNEAAKARVGVCRVLLPDILKKTVDKFFTAGEYAPSTPSGSFSTKSLAVTLEASSWAEGVLIAGDLGRNSETAIMLESYLTKYSGLLSITKDGLDYFVKSPRLLLERSNTLIVASFAQLQKIAIGYSFTKAFTFQMDLLHLIETLHDFTNIVDAAIIVRHLDNYIVGYKGQISTTKIPSPDKIWRVKTAAHASVWWIQNPSKPFEAITSSIVCQNN